MMFKAEVPSRSSDWTPALDAARLEWEHAAGVVLNATHADELAAGLDRLRAARDRFGRAMLALDRTRRRLRGNR